MPIGKNSIKRVSNNGYSKVQTDAPDMENSEIIAEKKPAAKKTTKVQAEKTAPKKAPVKKAAPKKSMEAEPDLSPVKTAERIIEKSAEAKERQGDGYINLGGELPYYLL